MRHMSGIRLLKSAPVAARFQRGAGVLILLVMSVGAAEARCQDAPGPGVDWTGCSKTQLLMSDDDLTGAIFTRTYLTAGDFSGSRLSGAKFNQAELSRTRFERADLSGSDFEKAVGWRTNFSQANLERANFSSADMSRSVFARARMKGSNFAKSEVNRSDFTGAICPASTCPARNWRASSSRTPR